MFTPATRRVAPRAAASASLAPSRRRKTLGAEGLELRDGKELLLRDSGPAFARACVELLNAPSHCEALGLAAREVVARRYDRKQIVTHIKEEISQRPVT